jgi:hypothetical protein
VTRDGHDKFEHRPENGKGSHRCKPLKFWLRGRI